MSFKTNYFYRKPLKGFNKMTLLEALKELKEMENSIKAGHIELARMKTAGNTAEGVYVTDNEKAVYVREVYDSIEAIEDHHLMLQTARNHTNAIVDIVIDGDKMTLNKALSTMNSLQRQLDGIGMSPGGYVNVGCAPGYFNDSITARRREKADYLKRLSEVVQYANRNETVQMP
jgi:hypothetical protein